MAIHCSPVGKCGARSSYLPTYAPKRGVPICGQIVHDDPLIPTGCGRARGRGGARPRTLATRLPTGLASWWRRGPSLLLG